MIIEQLRVDNSGRRGDRGGQWRSGREKEENIREKSRKKPNKKETVSVQWMVGAEVPSRW